MMMTIAGVFAVLAAVRGEVVPAAAGLLVAGAGAMERHGAMLMEAGEPRGIRWAMVAELLAMFFILAYCQVRLIAIDLTPLRPLVNDELKRQLATEGIGIDEFLQYTYRLVYISVGVTTVIYQGAMAIYYLRRRRAVDAALLADEPGAT